MSSVLPRHSLAHPDEGPKRPVKEALASEADKSEAKKKEGYQGLGWIPFLLCHLAVFGAIWSGVTMEAVILAVALYWVRMFGITAGYHRYFSHRSFKTSRVMQFLLAFLAQSSAQKGALWWASHHRHHHLYSDRPEDLHSVRQQGFFHAHLGWLFHVSSDRTQWKRVRDLSKFPELVFLDRYFLLPPTILAVACFLFAGWSGLFIGFFLSTVFVWHGTFTINSLSHVFGKRRFPTKDDSKNNWLLAIITMGEGWHNNHHRYMSSTRQGFYWWEIDLTYSILKAMSWVGLVWDLKEPPKRILEEGRRRDAAGTEAPEPTALPAPIAPAE